MMNSQRALLLTAPILALTTIAYAAPRAAKTQFGETGTLVEMQSVPCGSQERGITGFGGLLATAGIEHVNAKDKLCQEYVLRTSYLQYRIRPVHDKDPVLLPVGEKAQFRISKDHVLLSVPEGDGKVREYKVVGMAPLAADREQEEAAVQALAAKSLKSRPDPVKTPASEAAAAGSSVIGNTQGTKAGTDKSSSSTEGSARTIQDGSGKADSSTAAAQTKGSPAATQSPVTLVDRGNSRDAEKIEASAANKPLSGTQVMGLVMNGVSSKRVTTLVQERGISFRPTDEYLADLRSAGGESDLIDALRSAEGEPAPASLAAVASHSTAPVPSGGQGFQAAEHPTHAAQGRPADVILPVAANGGTPNSDAAAGSVKLGATVSTPGDSDGAVRQYREAIAANPHMPALHDNLGVALSRNGDLDAAVAEFREALRENPADAQAHINLGAVLQQQKQLDGAIREYQQALALPGGAEARYNLATALETKGDIDNAILELRQILATKPADARAHAALASALARKGDSAGARAQYEIAVQLAPGDAAIRASYDSFLARARAERADNDGAAR